MKSVEERGPSRENTRNEEKMRQVSKKGKRESRTNKSFILTVHSILSVLLQSSVSAITFHLESNTHTVHYRRSILISVRVNRRREK